MNQFEPKFTLIDTVSNQSVVLEQKQINIYLCGPTVYNDLHLGNTRPLIVFDVLQRVLQAAQYKVQFVQNITDIDDKIIKIAQQQEISEAQLCKQQITAYKSLLKKLNILPIKHLQVTDKIDKMPGYIARLVKKGFAYVSPLGNTYFSVSQLPQYGILANRVVETIEDEATDKRNKLDFVLWKQTTAGVKWNSPWGWGRPGWHVECAFLIDYSFKDQLTIHGGGVDLKFPHHENENAMHMALYDKPLTQHWMHIGHLMFENQKMSKSLQNFLLAVDFLTIHDFRILRWLFYQKHYYHPLDLSQSLIEQACSDIKRIQKAVNVCRTWFVYSEQSAIPAPKQFEPVFKALLNNLNFANAITHIWKLVKQINHDVSKQNLSGLKEHLSHLEWALNILGIGFKSIHTKLNVQLIKKWASLRKNGQLDKADEVRQKLIKKGLL
ncbi:cysteine--tRNA ligase [Mycoplasmoides pneumoniae]|uniref:Cysteine--tRNA ligase n=3 Tax=Mycoplasmoides pneumoniae TaxID=2104 RepID=SYC_MYCPN|nr:cysteine--tRNA ligase [Mycoplasmoides pneumoniae]P75423.1 RecName: Full=Cysteine--tRNA ligase; AltName: Full=Cysteinyl-tRNA synthetase; Short=CysRS [Mycoplasmoides pneumoniae M129]AAB96128.1 cysteinyl-tRNA synthetase [Mycoplasmoides pneumoniae M129]AGC04272.1 cysteinyl-tRNA synthetase [Mycoplasmoides pneumoniae M129-B7]ALA30237.1 cysteinyl-tRNA synthetase [Mycoplasmoides pneumoniae PI 1428]ALA32346.1 cysteinyl-tRNA synthetase [Mycoplasmoides pneumoniae 51494]ALA33046.1 cysteinyl-tRNA synth